MGKTDSFLKVVAFSIIPCYNVITLKRKRISYNRKAEHQCRYCTRAPEEKSRQLQRLWPYLRVFLRTADCSCLESIPQLDVPMDKLAQMTYQETAYEVMSRFLTDFTEDELKNCINKAYDSKFDTEKIAPPS